MPKLHLSRNGLYFLYSFKLEKNMLNNFTNLKIYLPFVYKLILITVCVYGT